MSFSNVHRLFYLVHIIFLQTLDAGKIFPPQNTFCLFVTGELIFEERMLQIAPSAKLGGVGGSLSTTTAQIPSNGEDDTIDLQRIYGAVYYISNDDKAKVEESAYNRMILADFEIYLEDERVISDSIDCLCMDEGLLPHAFPLPIYSEFPRELNATRYTSRLREIGLPEPYVSWLEEKLAAEANDRDAPPKAYIRPAWFVPPPIQPASATIDDGFGVQIQEYKLPESKFCAFVASDLVFEQDMRKIAPSAITVGAGMLWDRYVALGGKTVPGKYQQYRGFDKVWGVVYEIEEGDFKKFVRHGVAHSFFLAKVQTILKELYRTKCMTYDIGRLPSSFPYQVFQPSTLNLQDYLKRLSDVGVPPGYVEALERLAELLRVEPNGSEKATEVTHSTEYADPKPQNAADQER